MKIMRAKKLEIYLTLAPVVGTSKMEAGNSFKKV